MKKSTASGSRSSSMGQAFFAADPIKRPNYFPGRLLLADDFTMEQSYHREKQRRHNLHCHGFGVVHGLKVSTLNKDSAWSVAIEPGVAIDPAGNEIELFTIAHFQLPESPTAIEVGIRFLERLCDPVPALSDPALPDSQPSRAEEGCGVLLHPVSMPRGSRAEGTELDTSQAVLPLAYLVRVKGVWRASRKFKVPRAH